MKNDAEPRYQASKDMRIAESQIQWERFSSMLIVNTIFIGLLGFTYSNEFEIPIIIQFLIPVLGIVLCLLWQRMTSRGFMWVKFWTDKAREIEKKNNGNHLINPFMEGKIFKEKNLVRINTQKAASIIIAMFIILYSVDLLIRAYPYIKLFVNLCVRY